MTIFLSVSAGFSLRSAVAETRLAQSAERPRSGLSVKERLRRARQRDNQNPSSSRTRSSAPSASSRNGLYKNSSESRPVPRVKAGTKAELYYYPSCPDCVKLKRDLEAAGFAVKAYDVSHEGPDRKRYLNLGGPTNGPLIAVGDKGFSSHDINYIVGNINGN